MMRSLLFILLAGLTSVTAQAGEPPATPATDKDTVFAILAAEFAIYRDQFADAQDFYLDQARTTGHPYLAERATRLAMYNKQYADMLEAARLWSKADDSNQALFFLALAQAYNQRATVALEHMRRVLQQHGETDFTRLVNLLPAGDSSETLYLNELQQADQLHPDNYDIALALAILHQRQGDEQLALRYIDKAVELADDNTAVTEYAARLYLQQQQPQQALAVYRKAIDNNPHDLQLRQALAQLAMRYDLAEAARQLQYLLGHSPDDDYVIINLGLTYLKQQQLDDARQMFELLLRQQQRVSSANFYLGLIYQQQGDHDNALAHFLAVSNPDERPQAQEQIIRLYIKQGLYAEAGNRIQRGLAGSNDPAHREALMLLQADIHEQQGDITAAYQILSTLLADNPDSVELRYNRAMLAETENRIPQMEQDLRHIIRIQPDSALALNALGYTLANKTDRYREALQLIEQAYRLLPNDPAILDSLGWVLYRMGNTAEALGYLEKAMQLYPNAEIAAHLGEVLWALDRKEEASRVLHQALDKEPGHHILNDTVKRLNVSR